MTAQTCSRASCDGVAEYGCLGLCRTHYRHRAKQYPSVDPAVVTDHIAALRAASLTWHHISELTGLARNTLSRIATQRYVCADTAAAILAVPIPRRPYLAGLADNAKVSAIGTRRRLQGLSALGWDHQTVSTATGIDGDRLARLKRIDAACGFCTVREARRVDEVFQRLQMITPPKSRAGSRSRHFARVNGWPLPLAWDEDTIDDPNSLPHTGSGADDFADLIADHRYLGRDDRDIARRLGLKLDTLQQRLRRAGIERTGAPAVERAAS